jgi:signal transduction histidine kinase
LDIDSNQLNLLVTIAVMLLLVSSVIIIFMLSQRKKTKYLMQMQHMKEEQQNMLIEAAIKSEESERHRIAEELHDEVGAMLSATKLHFSAIQSPGMSEESTKLLIRSKDLLNESILKVRSISHNLHSSILKELGLHEAIRHFVQTTIGGGKTEVAIELDDDITLENDDRAITVYRLVQELLNNIIKHSSATKISISNTGTDTDYLLHIHHNGNGLSQLEFETLRFSEKGLGLKNIQNRIILLKGTILYSKGPDSNDIRIQIPQTLDT